MTKLSIQGPKHLSASNTVWITDILSGQVCVCVHGWVNMVIISGQSSVTKPFQFWDGQEPRCYVPHNGGWVSEQNRWVLK